MPGTRCSANGRPGFAGDRELWMQVAGAGAAWLRVPEARAVWRSAHSRALLAADARGRSGVSARPPSGARSRAQDCEVSEAPRRRVSGLAGRLGPSTVGLSGCRAGPHCRSRIAARVGAAAHSAANLASAPGAGFPVGPYPGTLRRSHCACVQSRDRNSLGSAYCPP